MMKNAQPEWHSALREALAAAGVTEEALVAGVQDELRRDPEWLALALSGEIQPSLAEYLLVSAVTGINVPVLTGRVAPTKSAFIALRSQTVGAVHESIAQAQERGLQLIEHLRLIASWSGDREATRSRMNGLRAMVNRDRYAPNAGRITATNVRRALATRGEVDSAQGPLIDLVGLIESCGVPVEFTDQLPDGVHGLTVQDGGMGSWDGVILINSKDYWVRQRYTLAHEFCHALFADDEHRFVNDEPTIASPIDAERRAETFASHFLAPQRGLQQVWSDALRKSRGERNAALCEVILHFGLSRSAAIFAVRNAHLVPSNDLSDLAADRVSVRALMKQTGNDERWNAECVHQHESGASNYLLTAALDLFEEGKVSVDTVAAVLDEPVERVAIELSQQGWTRQAN